jgi:hypothetical protein
MAIRWSSTAGSASPDDEVAELVGTARPVVLGGRSLGGRIASLLVAAGACPQAVGLLLLAYPLHPAGRPERLRTAHWPNLRVPVLFVQGDRDPLCDLGLLERERAALLSGADSRVHVLAGADHGFALARARAVDGAGQGARSRSVVLAEVVTVVEDWLRGLAATGDPPAR